MGLIDIKSPEWHAFLEELGTLEQNFVHEWLRNNGDYTELRSKCDADREALIQRYGWTQAMVEVALLAMKIPFPVIEDFNNKFHREFLLFPR